MRSLTLHLKILITLLVVLGISVTAYQIFVLGIPVTEDATDDLWNIDAKVEFVANPKDPVKIQMFVPPLSRDFVSLNESFISNNYGVSVNRIDGNRKVTWSARRAKGKQTLYYRLVLTKRYSGEKVKIKGPTFRDSIAVEGPEKIAAEALLAPIRQHSADVETFITEAIKRTNNLNDDNVKLLLAGDPSTPHKAKIVELLLSIAHVPVEKVHTIRLVADQPQTPELWLRSFNGNDWLYFNPETGEQGLPADRLLWWTGDENLITVDGGKKAMVTFSLNNSEMNAIRLAKLTDENTDANFLEYSLYGLPLQTQQTFMIMVMIPIGVLVILILRNLIGLQTLGTFTPVLIALAFRETQLGFGIVLFTIITALGLSLRSYLEHLKLQMLPRLSVVLTFVVVLIAAISLFSHKLGLERGLSVALFPMVILTMTIERLSITWEERGASHALKVAIGTLFAASLAHLIMSVPELVYFVFTFPAILLILVGFMLAMGRYRGYRLTELVRFKAFLKADSVMFGFWKTWKALEARGIMGINRRNADYVLKYNKRSLYPIVDDKIITKERALAAGIHVPEMYGVISTEKEIDKLDEIIGGRNDFVIKPAQGAGGDGILVIADRFEGRYRTVSGKIISHEEIEHQISSILTGLYSLGGHRDRALIEYRVVPDQIFKSISYEGVPDIRIIVLMGYPVMAMLRLPTRQSGGKANLHQGAIGVGVDLATGLTLRGTWLNNIITKHPDTTNAVDGVQLPNWDGFMKLAAGCYELCGLGYIGVDMVLDQEKGPLILELNARPG